MIAGRTNLRRFLANYDMPAVAAFPYLDLTLFKNLRHLHIVKQGTVALLVVLFHGRYQAETLSQLWKAFLLGGLGKAVVHVRPLIILAHGGGKQIFGCVSDAAELLEPQLSVLLFIVCGFLERSAICSNPSFLALEAK